MDISCIHTHCNQHACARYVYIRRYRMHVIVIVVFDTIEIVCILRVSTLVAEDGVATEALRPFESGNITEWLSHFEICAKANRWDTSVKAVKLLTLLEGEALAIWLDFTEEEQGEYSVIVDKLKRKLAPTAFSSLEAFHTQKLQPGEALSLFLQDLKQKLQHAMSDVTGAAREQLLLHQFLAGLPVSISKQLRAAGGVMRVETALE